MTTPFAPPRPISLLDRIVGRPAVPRPEGSKLPPTPAALTASASPRPGPEQSLTAAAKRITGSTLKARGTKRPNAGGEDWKGEAWDMYDLVGEMRFLANALAGRASQARLYVGRLDSNDPLATPEPFENADAQLVLDALGVTSVGRSQIMLRSYVGYFVSGETWLVGIPKALLPGADATVKPTGGLEYSLSDLDWRSLSSDEVSQKNDKIELRLAENDGAAQEFDPDDIWLIRSWRAYPRRGWLSDSPTLSSMPVLRELVGLTMAVGSQTDSRLAGAGMLIVPDSAAKAMKRAMGIPEDDPRDPFTDALIEAMMTPINDRSSAAAYVPLVTVVPDDAAEKLRHLTFEKPFDQGMGVLREEAIRRYALGADAPPELLLGTGGMNHWGAYLVREDVVTTHIEPPVALFCDTLTTQYLRPALLAGGMDEDTVNELVVWYDVSHLVARPNRSSDAQAIYDKGELSGVALRRENGFDEGDAPAAIGDEMDPAVDLALQLVAQAPSLMQAPGLPSIVEQIRAVQSGEAATAEAAEEGTGVEGGGDSEDAGTTAPDRPETDAPDGGDSVPSTADAPAPSEVS